MVKNSFALFIFLLSTSSFAKDYILNCTAKHNLDLVLETDVTLIEKEKNKLIGSFEGFDFILSSGDKDNLELQVYNGFEPSRIYSTAKVADPGAFVEQSVWKRDYLLDVRCTHK